jgi:hypothetical protein
MVGVQCPPPGVLRRASAETLPLAAAPVPTVAVSGAVRRGMRVAVLKLVLVSVPA